MIEMSTIFCFIWQLSGESETRKLVSKPEELLYMINVKYKVLNGGRKANTKIIKTLITKIGLFFVD